MCVSHTDESLGFVLQPSVEVAVAKGEKTADFLFT